MRILLLNLYYPPDTSATAKMAQSVVDAVSISHNVTVLCGRPCYDPTERRAWRPYQTEIAGRARIIHAGSTDFPRFDMKKRVLNYLSYVALAIPGALFVPCDAVVAMTDPPFQGIVGAIVAMLKRKPYIYNIRDVYPDMAVGGSIVEPGRIVRIWEKLHRWALCRATRVIVLGEDMRARIVAKGVEPSRVLIVRDGTDILPPLPTPDPEVVSAIRGNSSFVLVHAGNLGFYGAWNTLVTAARLLAGDGVGLVFVGDGAQRSQIEAAAEGSGNIRFLEFFPASKIPSVLAAADAHVITVKRGLEGVVVPSKMYGILAAGKPIVAVAPKETDAVSLGIQRGFAVAADPDRPGEVVKAVRTLVSNPNKLKAMGEAARAAAPDYDRVKQLQKFVEIIDHLTVD
ncbi:MAG TPA: glycosyltransferase family 4 protein [Candidatus Limnocylindria bacterium]|nr:glycosyltransferase family 4 protein [Candidatus Limnocylindria bacterium]